MRTTTRERRLAKADRLDGYAEKREAASDDMHEAARAHTAGIPFGQPILVGHHSQKRHERAIERGWDAMGRAVENDRKAEEMAGRAANIRAAADAAVYDDDADAIQRLEERIAKRECERDAMKAANAEYRAAHKAELKAMDAYERGQALPFPAWALTNIGATIRNDKKRMEKLKREAEHGPTDRIITARYDGECEDCGATLAKGDTIRYNLQQGARCRCCEATA